LLPGVVLMAGSTMDFYAGLPESLAGWKKVAPPVAYTPATLSTYIDGGAELYISYNFQNSLALTYHHETEGDITVDIFDMSRSDDAFGVFAHSRETSDERVGQGSEYAAGLLTFWQDRYYVSILAYPETAGKREVVFQLGQAISGLIRTRGPLPPLLALLPVEGLVPDSTHFFHHYVWLNSFCFVSNENVLNIEPDTPAVLGKYRAGAATCFLLLLRYPDDPRAAAAQERFRTLQLAGSASGEKQDPKDGRWTVLRRQGRLLMIVLKAPDSAVAADLLARVKP
jgi:hypothetical protein